MKRILIITSRTIELANWSSLLIKWEMMPIIMNKNLMLCRKMLNLGKRSTEWKLKKKSSSISKLWMPKGRTNFSKWQLADCKMTLRNRKLLNRKNNNISPWLQENVRKTQTLSSLEQTLMPINQKPPNMIAWKIAKRS